MRIQRRRMTVAGALAFLLFAASTAYAVPILVDDADLTGTRGVGNGITAGGAWSTSLDLEFAIVDLGGGQWRYTYQFFVDTPDPSHFIFEVSDSITETNIAQMILLPNFPLSDEDPRFYGPNFPGNSSNPGLTVDFYGVKAEEGDNPSLYTFISPRAPIWGDFYIKGGNDSFGFNDGIGTDPNGSTNFTDWIPVPDTVNGQGQAPEPGTLLLIGAGLIALYRRRRA